MTCRFSSISIYEFDVLSQKIHNLKRRIDQTKKFDDDSDSFSVANLLKVLPFLLSSLKLKRSLDLVQRTATTSTARTQQRHSVE